jgi:hypothetical protein
MYGCKEPFSVLLQSRLRGLCNGSVSSHIAREFLERDLYKQEQRFDRMRFGYTPAAAFQIVFPCDLQDLRPETRDLLLDFGSLLSRQLGAVFWEDSLRLRRVQNRFDIAQQSVHVLTRNLQMARLRLVEFRAVFPSVHSYFTTGSAHFS